MARNGFRRQGGTPGNSLQLARSAIAALTNVKAESALSMEHQTSANACSFMHLVEILLPITDRGVSRCEIEPLARRLTDKFGGVTVFMRSAGDGVWDDGGTNVRDDIIILEVMTPAIDHGWWRALRAELELRLSQSEIVVRSHRVERL
jgi:hypothetical protein